MYQIHLPALSDARIAQLVEESRFLDLAPGPGGSRASDPEPTLARYHPLLQDLFPGPWQQARVFALYPSSQLVRHADPALPSGVVRYHLPIQSNDDCWCFHDTRWQQLRPGRFFSMDPAKPHGAVNWGTTVRLHLVIDRSEY